MCVCARVRETECGGWGGWCCWQISHSAVTLIYTLIYHSTKNELWRKEGRAEEEEEQPGQKIGADRDEARLHETKSEEKKMREPERGRKMQRVEGEVIEG